MHTCNAWCFGGVHALIFENSMSDRAHTEPIARALAQRAGLQLAGIQEIFAPGAPRMGAPTKDGVARGRVVIWAK